MKARIIVETKGNETTYTLKDERRYPSIVLVTTYFDHYEATAGHLDAHDGFIVSPALHGKQFKTARGAESAAVKYLTSRLPPGDIDVELVESAIHNPNDVNARLQLPIIHLNGTSGDVLIEQLSNASNALRIAINALMDAAPNQRDYYPLGNEAWKRAKNEFDSRVDRLTSVRQELVELADGISDMNDAG